MDGGHRSLLPSKKSFLEDPSKTFSVDFQAEVNTSNQLGIDGVSWISGEPHHIVHCIENTNH